MTVRSTVFWFPKMLHSRLLPAMAEALAALADREIKFLDTIALLPDPGLFCRARLDGWRLACLSGLIDTYGKAIGTGLP